MRIYYAVIVAGMLSGSAVAETASQIDSRMGAWLERNSALQRRMESDAKALVTAVESGDQAKICAAARPLVENQKSMRDLQVEYAQIYPERTKVAGFEQKREQMDAQIVELEAQLKKTCG